MILCRIFGHKWKCFMAVESKCRFCGINYKEFCENNEKEKMGEKKV